MRQHTWKPGSDDLPGSVEDPGHLIHKDVVDQAGVVHHQHLVHFKKGLRAGVGTSSYTRIHHLHKVHLLKVNTVCGH
jgi:hypothetical protein